MSETGGRVERILVADHQKVRAGDKLLTIDPTDARLALERAEANLAQVVRETAQLAHRLASVEARLASEHVNVREKKENVARCAVLVRNRAVGKEEFRHAQEALERAEWTVKQLEAEREVLRTAIGTTTLEEHPRVLAAAQALREGSLRFSRTEVFAPVAGQVARRTVQAGEVVAPGRPLLSIAALDHLWVDANFKEGQLEKIRLGQSATIEVDVYGLRRALRGHVAGFSAGTGSAFSVLPAQNATGNWIKIVQRVPVRIKLDDAPHEDWMPLLIGLSATVTVD